MLVNRRDFDGLTPLHFAAGSGHCDVMEFLLSNGAKLDRDMTGGTALHSAASLGQIKACKELYVNAIFLHTSVCLSEMPLYMYKYKYKNIYFRPVFDFLAGVQDPPQLRSRSRI